VGEVHSEWERKSIVDGHRLSLWGGGGGLWTVEFIVNNCVLMNGKWTLYSMF
jgi:hypothetical protein